MKRNSRKPKFRKLSPSGGCRCHGSCKWCRDNRLYSDRRRRSAADAELAEYRRLYLDRG